MSRHYAPQIITKSAATDDDADAAEVVKAIETFQTSVEAKVGALANEVKEAKAVAKAATDRADALEAKLNRPGRGGQTEEQTVEAKAFASYLRRGREAMAPEEIKALRVSDDTQGGFQTSPEFVAELLRNIVLFSPVRSAARIGQTSAGSVKIPARTGTMTATWVGETDTRPSTQPTYGQIELTVYELAAYVDVSLQLLEDSAINLESELAFDFGEQFGKQEGNAFITGNGNKKPLGLINEANIAIVKTGVANNFAASNPADNLMDLYHNLPTYYAQNAVWGMNRTTIGVVRKFKDAQGRYLFADPLAEGAAPTILGRPVVEMPDMPDVGSGTTPIVFGDFSNFRIYDRVGSSILRDDFTQRTNGIVRFHGRKRVAAGVTKTEAFRLLKCST